MLAFDIRIMAVALICQKHLWFVCFVASSCRLLRPLSVCDVVSYCCHTAACSFSASLLSAVDVSGGKFTRSFWISLWAFLAHAQKERCPANAPTPFFSRARVCLGYLRWTERGGAVKWVFIVLLWEELLVQLFIFNILYKTCNDVTVVSVINNLNTLMMNIALLQG